MTLRSTKIAEAYLKEQKEQNDFRNNKDYTDDSERILRSFEYWYVINNLYPYDIIAQEHHMLVPKRVFGSMSECTRDEWNEYKYLLSLFEKENHYDCILENFSKGRSIMKHLHLHLIVLKN